ncbi:DUF1178 family protein [Rhizorhapis sp.]|uniref:DUF1178 family protein n=1 Tax=Rhizorhapis sp. TaxID=1968842 RepID=UPI002B48A58E|nr:DUF1178 family protein [Rhizorhapis sp.]HKR16701.1 DUF1178 family protein [Rhizorhapis sp.]HKX36225.1 DUF1178 family protein [Rhizorhapis sp.]
MIVFDLKCYGYGHVFEGWFGSSADYEKQRAGGMIACPMCGDTQVRKAVMSPAVSPKSNQKQAQRPVKANLPAPVPVEERGVTVSNAPSSAEMEKMRSIINTLAQVQARVLEKSEWVGRAFADRARAMHYGEEPHKQIHGEVASGEARALIEEGVEVAPLPLPVVPPEIQN